MTASADGAPDLLVDTSVAVALVIGDHEYHRAASDAVADRRLGLAGHAAFEAFSVLTRLPAPSRLTAEGARRALQAGFPHSRFLGPQAASTLLGRLDSLGIAGGAVYDALVGAVAAEHGLALATRDGRALETYRALEVRVELL